MRQPHQHQDEKRRRSMNVREILSGRTLALGIGLFLGLAALPATAGGVGDNGALTLRRQDAWVTRVRGYWTPERLRAARPLPLNHVQAADAHVAGAPADAGPTPAPLGPAAGRRRP